jgi:hypothetical protein
VPRWVQGGPAAAQQLGGLAGVGVQESLELLGGQGPRTALLTRNRKGQWPITDRQHGWRIIQADGWPVCGLTPLWVCLCCCERGLEAVRDGRDIGKRTRDLATDS